MSLRSNLPYQVIPATILGAFQGTNHYDITTDHGRCVGVYHGVSRGPGGVMEGGGLMPGTVVWVAYDPGEHQCAILGMVQYPWSASPDDPKQFATFPQVVGFEPEKRLVGQLYDELLANIHNRPSDVLHDLVNGEWGIASPHGAAVAVELFRSWLRAGPMSGLWCYAESQLTRLAGLDFEFLTLAQNDYDRRHGNSIVSSKSRVFYPSEALSDLQPRELEINGAIHGGRHRYLGAQAPRGTPRTALFHELLANDGTYSVTSAAGIFLQRYSGVTIPEESQPAAVSPLKDQPLDADNTRQTVLTTPIPFVKADEKTTDGLNWVQHTLDIIDGLFTRCDDGYNRLPIQWPDTGFPAEMPEGADPSAVVYEARMWRSLPRSFSITIDPIQKERIFYSGRSMIALLPDGSIVIEDANNSQIVMSGGNIMFGAAHDLIFTAGRNIVTIAGNDLSSKAKRNVDIASNDGRVSIKAEDLLSLLGGNGEASESGVLIESKTQNPFLTKGTGADQQIGGILIKSATGAYVQGSNVGVTSTEGDTILQANLKVDLIAHDIVARAPGGLILYPDGDSPMSAYFFTAKVAYLPQQVFINKQAFVRKSLVVGENTLTRGQIAAGGQVIGSAVGPYGEGGQKQFDDQFNELESQATGNEAVIVADILATEATLNTYLLENTPLNEQFWDVMGFSFATSQQLHYDVEFSFTLPELSWQTMARRAEKGEGQAWEEKPVISPSGDLVPTCPAPGYEAWTADGNYQLNDTDMYSNLTTGGLIPHEDGHEVLPEPTPLPIDKNFLIGPDL